MFFVKPEKTFSILISWLDSEHCTGREEHKKWFFCKDSGVLDIQVLNTSTSVLNTLIKLDFTSRYLLLAFQIPNVVLSAKKLYLHLTGELGLSIFLGKMALAGI